LSLVYIDYRGPIVSTNAAYRGGRGRFWMTEAGKNFKEFVAFEAKKAMRGKDRLNAPIAVSVLIDFWFARTNSDIDGPVKLVLDSLNGIVWEDDKQVVELSVGKHRALRPRDVGVALTVSPVLVAAKERKAL